MILEITEEAKDDISDAYNWYESQKIALGDEFINQFKLVCKTIIKAPEGFRKVRGYHQISLKQFPFVVLYQLIDDKIIVYAVFHTSRNPKKKYSFKSGK